VSLSRGGAAPKAVHLTFLYSDGNMSGTLKAYKTLLAERPDLRGNVSISFLTESVFEDTKPFELTGADVLVLDIMNQQLLDRFNAAHKTDLIAAVRRRGTVFSVGEGLLPKEHYIEQGEPSHRVAHHDGRATRA
jgi:cobaltochelatase CobN